MKRSPYLLQLDNPCTEPWEGMHPTATGRFCDSCAKNVVDFTARTDDQILNTSSYCLSQSESTVYEFPITSLPVNGIYCYFQYFNP